jgi:hypothetical protein
MELKILKEKLARVSNNKKDAEAAFYQLCGAENLLKELIQEEENSKKEVIK